MESQRPRLSIVIPVYGSAPILRQLADRLEETLDGEYGAGRFEVVLVHDCGPDDAWSVIEELARSRPWLRAMDLRMNAGQHNAIMAGLAQASGEIVVTMDDDLQHSPSDVPRLVAALEAGSDVCYAQFRDRKHAWWKLAGSRFNDIVAQRLLKKPKGLYLSPFRAFTRDIRNEVLRYEGPYVYIDGLIIQATRKIATVEVEHHARGDGRSGYSLGKSISLWLKMATSFSVAPLRLASLLGLLVSGFAFVLMAVVVTMKLLGSGLAVGWASLMVSVLFLGGIQLVALGAIGEYVGRVLLTLNRKPQYLVRSVLNGANAEIPDAPHS